MSTEINSTIKAVEAGSNPDKVTTESTAIKSCVSSKDLKLEPEIIVLQDECGDSMWDAVLAQESLQDALNMTAEKRAAEQSNSSIQNS